MSTVNYTNKIDYNKNVQVSSSSLKRSVCFGSKYRVFFLIVVSQLPSRGTKPHSEYFTCETNSNS